MRGVYRHTIRDLVLTLGSGPMNERGLAPVRRVAREALASLITEQAVKSGKLEYLRSVTKFPGFAGALARTLEDLRLNEITPQQLRSITRSGPDLALLLEMYEHELEQRRFADHALRVQLSAEAVRNGSDARCGIPLLLLDVEARTKSEARLLDLLAAHAPEVLSVNSAQETTPVQTCLESVQHYALSGITVPEREPDETVQLFSASGEALECVEIARRVLDAARGGTRFDDIAVLLRNPERYQPLIAEAFSRARVPAHFSHGARRPNASGRAFLALLHCREEGLSASRFAEYLSLGQMPDESSRLRAPAAWERLLVDAAVIGGRDRWEARLSGLKASLRSDGSERELDLLEDLTDLALPVIAMLDDLPVSAKWGDWLDRLGELALRTLNAPEDVTELLDELRPMADVGPVSLGDVLFTLAPGLLTTRDRPEEARYGKVFVGGIEEARGMAFRIVFLPGLNEGVFPRLVREDPLLLDEQRELLGIGSSDDDAALLKTAAACASAALIASWSRIDLATGRERVPSFYAFEILKAARGGDPDLAVFEREARTGSDAKLGWPAPVDPAKAIDDAEYDLSYLLPAWEGRQKGAGYYLKDVNPHVYWSLIARGWRWKKEWKWSDGLLAEKEVLTALDRYRPSRHAFSPTELEQYARCPYRFLLRAIYRLRPAKTAEAIQRMDPALRGEIYHSVQSGLLTELRDAAMLPVTESNLDDVQRRLDGVLARISTEAADLYVPAIAQVWQADIESLRADLRGWLRHMAAHDEEWTPELFEWSFGTRDEPLQIADGFLLQGRVDLIERHTSGQLRITDHKTGKIPEKPPSCVGGGEALQPVFYALAAEALLGSPVAGGRLFYATLRQNFQQFFVPLDAAARASAGTVLSSIETALKDGFLPAAPRQDACRTCDYQPVCGPYEEERTKRGRKAQGPLEQLIRIRGLR
jgi:RecB family exonuclease